MNVNSWFSNYVKDNINIPQEKNINGKKSRNWLTNQIITLSNEDGFPSLYSLNEFVKMGSYARKTQVTPLNDIDQMIVFSASGSKYYDLYNYDDIRIKVPNSATDLINFINNDSELNSIKIMNHLKNFLKNIHQYRNSEIKRNQEVIRLELKSTDWGFDIIPGFKTEKDENGIYYYLIPNGKGNWKKTNPIIDRDNLDYYQKKSNINIREAIRILKFWKDKHNYVHNINSYLMETLILDFLDNNSSLNFYNSRIFIAKFLNYLSTAIFDPVKDRKNIQGNLNDLDSNDKYYIRKSIENFINIVTSANEFERTNENEKSICQWRNFFGE